MSTSKRKSDSTMSASASQPSSAHAELETSILLAASGTETMRASALQLLTDARAELRDAFLRMIVQCDLPPDELRRQMAVLYSMTVHSTASCDALEKGVAKRSDYEAERLQSAKRLIEDAGYEGSIEALFELPETEVGMILSNERSEFSEKQSEKGKLRHIERLGAFEQRVFDEWSRSQENPDLYAKTSVLVTAMLRRWDGDIDKAPTPRTVTRWIKNFEEGKGLTNSRKK